MTTRTPADGLLGEGLSGQGSSGGRQGRFRRGLSEGTHPFTSTQKGGASTRACPLSGHFSSSSFPLFGSRHCRRQRSLQFIRACLAPRNTSFLSHKYLSPSSSNMLRVTTFSASWGSCPLHTVMTHSAKAVSSAPSGSISPDPLQLTNERVTMLDLPGNQCSWGSLLPLLPFLSLKPVASSLHLPTSFYTSNHED